MFRSHLLRTGILYFFVLLAIALWVRDIPYQFAEMHVWDITPELIIKMSSMGDPATFVNAALNMAGNGWITQEHDWVFNLWPPGFVILEALIIKVFGADVPLILVLQVLAAALFSVVLVMLYDLLRECFNSPVAIALPLTIFAFPVSRVFLLEPVGITLGESFSIGFFLLGILLALSAARHGSHRHGVSAGVLIALSAYFRSQFELLLLVMTSWLVLWVIMSWLLHLQAGEKSKVGMQFFGRMAIVLLVAHAVMLPWRAYHAINQGSARWVSTLELVYMNSVITSDQLASNHGGFVVEGGGNLVCRIDPSTCGDVGNAKKLFMKTFMSNPVQWYSLKLERLGSYWFSSLRNWVHPGIGPSLMDKLTNGLILCALVILGALLFARKVRLQAPGMILTWVGISLASTYWAVITMVHFEVRYFYAPKIIGLTMLLMAVGLYFQSSRALDTNKVD